MKSWPGYPVIYEINTWVWLWEQSQTCKTHVTLGTVPAEEWDFIADLVVDTVWLMGVWERSPAGIAIANRNKGLVEDFRQALPDYRPADNVGSPYCVRQYVVDEHLGGREGLVAARAELGKRGLRLLLDFVPNQMAPDIRGLSIIPNTSFRETTMMPGLIRRHSLRRQEMYLHTAGTTPAFPPARRAATECLSAGTPASGDRDPLESRRPVRRRTLRRGDACHQRNLRTNLGQPRWCTACSRVLA